jgi:putative DNA primase/helicase
VTSDYETVADRVVQLVKASPKTKADSLPADADHYRLASALVDAIERASGHRPVYALGRMWRVREALWAPMTLDALAVEVGQRFGGLKFCRRGGDFRSVAQLAAEIAAEDDFFDRAPVGIAGPVNFWRIDSGTGETNIEPLAPEHRQRMRLRAEPDPDAEAPLWDRLLDHAFPRGSEDDGQRDLLQTLFGGALARALWRHRIAVLLLGATTSGKTTLLNVLASLFPADMVGATNPQRWGSEYYLAALAGKLLNIVGELDPDEPIPGGSFKSVVGCDVIEGRHPTHRPFSFVCTAAHFVNANRLPPTVDRSEAFFRRWRIIEFTRAVPDEDVIVDLADRIVLEESGAVAAWMLEGAQRLALARGAIPETAQHRALIQKWRTANNSALQFLVDPAACALDPTEQCTNGVALFEHYKKWAAATGVRAFGRNNFYDAVVDGAGRLGVTRNDSSGAAVFAGIKVVACKP